MKRSPGISRRGAVRLAGALAAGAGAALTFARRARADGPVDLQLVLAVDTSGSVNQERFELQKQGYVQAFRNPRVVRAIQSGTAGAIGVAMVQWTGPALQVIAVPWMRLANETATHAFAAAIEAGPRQLYSGGTSISGAIDYSLGVFAACPFTGGRRVIDISGDGSNNRGRPAHIARDDAVAQNITINGLPILALEPTLDQHYKADVIGGINPFIVVATSYEEFADAILKKLITEIAGLVPPASG